MALTASEHRALLADFFELERRRAYRYDTYFPDTGPLRRELYPKSIAFFAAGAKHLERLLLGANRSSKTVSAAFEVTGHLTGAYHAWWPGRRFDSATDWWVAGDTHETTRDILQRELFGGRDHIRRGTWNGMVPAHLILDRTLKNGVADALDTVWVQHCERVHGAPGFSTLQFKAYNQGRLAFQGTTLTGGVWLDEEPPPTGDEAPSGGGTPSGNADIYTECLMRTGTTRGMIMVTLTPLRGLTPFLEHWLETAEMCDAEGRLVNAKIGIFGEEAA